MKAKGFENPWRKCIIRVYHKKIEYKEVYGFLLGNKEGDFQKIKNRRYYKASIIASKISILIVIKEQGL
jgi:hypothetical protein